MTKSEILTELDKIAVLLSHQLDSGHTSIENCIAASDTCLTIIEDLKTRSTDFRSQQSLDDLMDSYQMIQKFKRSGGNESEEDEEIYTRYCTIQTQHCTQKLIDTVNGIWQLDPSALENQKTPNLTPVN